MNMHVPQTLESRAEAETLMMAEHTVINSASGLASIVPVQGDRLGPMLMSKNRRFLTKREWSVCLGWATDEMLERARTHGPKLFPCKSSELFSLALSENYNWKSGTVEILRGKLVAGVVNKKVLLKLVHDIWHDRGTAASLDFVHCVNRASGAYNTLFPTTITFEEVSNTCTSKKACQKILSREQDYVKKIMQSPSLTAEKKETLLQKSMARASRDITEYVFQNSSASDTGFRDLVESGSKGNRVNFCMVRGCLGKMLLPKDAKGVFSPPEGAPVGATRRCFTTSDGRKPFNDAFVTSGYAEGMTLEQYAVHSKAGRVGLIDSANKVGKVGYQYRRLSTINVALCTRNGMVVDTSSGMIISFKYGDDGRSPYYSEYERIIVPQPPSKTAVSRAVPEASSVEIDSFLAENNSRLHSFVNKICEFSENAMTKVHNVAVSVRRVLHDHQMRYGSRESGIAAIMSRKEVDSLCTLHGRYLGYFTEYWLRIHLHMYALWGMSARGIQKAIEDVDKRLWKCRVTDGEPVGLLLSSSFSAAATQVTLDSFHNIGAENGNFKALEELINMNKSRKHEVVKFKLQSHIRPSEWVAKHAKVTLKDVVVSRGMPRRSDYEVLKGYWEFPDRPGEFTFAAVTRLLVRTTNPYLVKKALLSVGASRVAYAKDTTGDYVFHTDFFVSDVALCVTVSGAIPGCRLSPDGTTVICKKMPDLLEYFLDIDLSSVYTNDFHAMCEMYGIEAARLAVAKEMKTTLRTFGVTMSSRHIDLLLDKMTSVGLLLGCTRHGLRKSNPDGEFVRRATFEQPTEVLTRAAAMSGRDALDGPLARQVFGLQMRMGSYHPYMDVMVDKVKEKQFAVEVSNSEDSDTDDLDIGVDMWMPKQTPVDDELVNIQNDPWFQPIANTKNNFF